MGTSTDTIEFTSNLSSPTKNSWKGIKVIGTTSPLGVGNQVTMEYCKGLYANYFIDLDEAYHGPYIFKNCYFADNFQVNKDGGMPFTTFENCGFVSNTNALGTCQFDSWVRKSYFRNNVNGVSGIAIVEDCHFSGNTGIALSPYGSTTGCIIENNNIGVSCYFNNVNNMFKNNIITGNTTGIEILSYFNGSITFTGNSICNNSTYNVKLLTQNNADLSNNCWCSTDSTLIRSTIYDGYVNTSKGLVNFLPLGANCPQISLGISKDINKENALVKIFPNPFSLSTTFEFNNLKNEKYSITIYDIHGNTVRTISNIYSPLVNIERKNLNSGLYIFQLRSESGYISTGKLLVE